MKTSLKKFGYKLSALFMVLALSHTALLAEDGKTSNAASALSPVQVVGGFLLLVAFVVIPAFKTSRKTAVK